MRNNGFKINNVDYVLGNILIIADTPAKSLIMGTKSHTGYDSCPYCKVYGEYYKGRVVFVSKGYPRTDSDYKNLSESNQLVSSPLLTSNDFLCDIPVDCMHACYLGVMKKLLNIYVGGVKHEVRAILSKEKQDALNQQLLFVRKHTRREFQRHVRPIKDLSFF